MTSSTLTSGLAPIVPHLATGSAAARMPVWSKLGAGGRDPGTHSRTAVSFCPACQVKGPGDHYLKAPSSIAQVRSPMIIPQEPPNRWGLYSGRRSASR